MKNNGGNMAGDIEKLSPSIAQAMEEAAKKCAAENYSVDGEYTSDDIATGFEEGAKWALEYVKGHEKTHEILAELFGKPEWKMSLLKCKACDTNHITNGKDFICVCNVNTYQEQP